ncbi:hypothetical protein BV20DRAFT_859837 [Pilatotrama ljubarskyi]|nr:hypothetical protein BV20DRAFT_859837 [Pilatotrama ljubarskyi]
MNVNKRKLDAPNGPGSDVQSGSSGSNAAGVPVSPRGPRNGLPAPPTTLPPRPASGNNGAPSAPRVDRQRDRQPPPHLRDRPAATAQPETTAAAGSANTPRRTPPPPADELVSRSAKRARTDGRRGRDGTPSGPGSASNKAHAAGAQSGGSAKPVENATTSHAGESRPIPSLLSRLNATVPNGKAAGGPGPEREPAQRDRGYSRRGMADSEPERPSTDPVVPAKRRAEPDTLSGGPKLPSASGGRAMPPPSVRSRPSRPSPEPDKDPVRGFSIRGAAKAANRPPPSAVEGVASKPATSLLQRLQPLGDGSAVQGSDDGGGRRGRKRGRHA